MKILLFLYDCLFFLGFLAYLPVYIWRRKTTLKALDQKLGWIKNTVGKEVIWIQVVSVGEANAIGNLIRKIKENYLAPIVISTTTLTGNKVARQKYSHCAQIVFFPLDTSWIVRHFIKVFRPIIFIAVETEIWPNLFSQLQKKKIPILIINGRISDRAFKRYKLIKPFLAKIINKCDYIAVQNQMYKKRFTYLGADKEKIIVSGNMKFESIIIDQQIALTIKNSYEPVLKPGGSLLFVAGCTHPAEEEILLQVYQDITESSGDFKFLIAPRHPERVNQVARLIRSKGFLPFKISQVPEYFSEDITKKRKIVFILDTIGELIYFYGLADICFVGGSLSANGGHNILEPIYFGKPTIFGPHMDNFLDVEEVVLEKGAGLKVADRQELRQALMRLVKDEALRKNLNHKCQEVFQQERKSLEKNLGIVLQSLKKSTHDA
ncbi:MAG: 3-deoxy-D-manno-octulosonic acid transferase [Candidatus Omnitrophica bacterium]|nr:3-deoxy-D-manno-octulosonic acid transferase [Candidatus Omnitrophota bacterium]